MRKKIVFMGTPNIAVACLESLIEAGFEVPLVISQPDKPKGRGKHTSPTPVKEVAIKHNIEVYQPQRLRNNPEAVEKLTHIKPDFFAVVAYGKILPVEILEIPKFACINVHFSLLPLYRGAAPLNWSIYNGDKYTGVATMKMDEGMDTGDILLVEKTLIGKKDAVVLAEELSKTGSELLVKTLKDYNNIIPVKQDDSLATLAPMMSKEQGLIDWNRDAENIERMIRAFVPWPTAYTILDGKILKIFSAEVTTSSGEPGIVAAVTKNSFTVGTNKGSLVINEVQLEGKKRMPVASFLSGFKLNTGMKLG